MESDTSVMLLSSLCVRKLLALLQIWRLFFEFLPEVKTLKVSKPHKCFKFFLQLTENITLAENVFSPHRFAHTELTRSLTSSVFSRHSIFQHLHSLARFVYCSEAIYRASTKKAKKSVEKKFTYRRIISASGQVCFCVSSARKIWKLF